jgi:Agrobacterium tumefaciens protein Atu4866
MSRILSALGAAALAAATPQSTVAQPAGTAAANEDSSSMNSPDVVGMWVTGNGFIRLELLPGGRYDEARGERKSAYKGSYTVRGSNLHFVDDSGFTATGIIVDGVLSVGGDSFRKE